MVNRVTYTLNLPMLYENIALQHHYKEKIQEFSSDCPVEHLASTLDKETSGLIGPAIKSFRVDINVVDCGGNHHLSYLLPHLSSLKSLCLISDRNFWRKFEPSRLSGALQTVKGTLENLTLCVGNDLNTLDTSSIGSLADSSALKTLCIQSCILLGDDRYGLGNTTAPSQMLPLGLQKFTLHCCAQRTIRDVCEDVVGHYEKCVTPKSGLPCAFVPYKGGMPRPLRGVAICMMYGTQHSSLLSACETKFLEDFCNVDVEADIAG